MSTSSGQQEQTSSSSTTKPDDSFLAIVILTIAIVVAISGGIYVWSNRFKLGLVEPKLAKISTFNPPIERQLYINKKSQYNRIIPSEFNELKKLLMKRALKTIPLLLTLQNEGNSISMLYKRGILTDDLHNDMKELKSFIDVEFQDVQNEAEDMVEGWGQLIWPQAMQNHQMIIKHDEEKEEAARIAEEEKRTSVSDKKKDKEKTKKALKSTNGTTSTSVVDRAAEAERIAKELIEEEDREKKKKNKSNGNKNKK